MCAHQHRNTRTFKNTVNAVSSDDNSNSHGGGVGVVNTEKA